MVAISQMYWRHARYALLVKKFIGYDTNSNAKAKHC